MMAFLHHGLGIVHYVILLTMLAVERYNKWRDSKKNHAGN